MKVVPTGRAIPRSDVVVVVLQSLWLVGWLVEDLARRATEAGSPPLSIELVVFLIVAASIETPFLYGVATGRRWGFVGLAVFAAMGCLGSLMNPVARGMPVTVPSIGIACVDAALLLYCVFRLRQERVEMPLAPRTSALRFGDALMGALGASWALALAFVAARTWTFNPLRPLDIYWLSFLGVFVALYLVACAGAGFGRRWGFVAMIVASALVLVGVIPNLSRDRYPVPQEFVVSAFSIVAVLYCAVRLRRSPNAEAQS